MIENEFIYIAQSPRENTRCKIGITNDLCKRLAQYNSTTGVGKEALYEYLFTCSVSDMYQVEADITDSFRRLRETKNREVYFYNSDLFDDYVDFIKKHALFLKEIFVKKVEKDKIKIVKRTTPSLKERGINPVDVVNKAKKKKDDEFYTRYEDIEKEVAMYPADTWLDKTVFCNCDDAVDDDERRSSAFALFFIKKFEELGLKKLICTHYSGGLDLFNQGSKAYIFTKYGFTDGEEEYNFPKGYSGSFDDPRSIKILNEEADVVCTNPPFSIARDYWKLLIESGKSFLIVSSINNVVTTSYIPYFMNRQVWAGYDEIHWFENPKREIVRANGQWYTNLPIKNRPKHKNIKIIKLEDIPEKYKKFDDKGMLLVDNNYIPNDYNKPFAISVTPVLSGVLELGYDIVQGKRYMPNIQEKNKFSRVIIQKIK